MRGKHCKLGHGTGVRGIQFVTKHEARLIVAGIKARVAFRLGR